jgi:hypothetical protein
VLVFALRRWGMALIALISGWLTGFVVFLLIARASPLDEPFWAVCTGLFCLAAWFVVGAPLAVLNPNLSTIFRALTAVILSGFIGMGMLFAFLGAIAINVISLLAFLMGAVSMAVYVLISRSSS